MPALGKQTGVVSSFVPLLKRVGLAINKHKKIILNSYTDHEI